LPSSFEVEATALNKLLDTKKYKKHMLAHQEAIFI